MTLRPETADALLREIATAQSEWKLPSMVAGVVRDGELAWTGSRGRFATRDEDRPDADTQYRIGSITKTLTAVLVMQCRDDGLLGLADPIGKHLPEVAYGDLTVRQLLAHCGGMNSEPAGDWWERHPGVGFTELAAAMDEAAAIAPPDRRHHYSNLGYGVLGELVSRQRSAPWMDLIQQRILDPLEMRRTSYRPAGRAAQGFSVHPWTGVLDDEPEYDAVAMAPAGQLWSTITDLGRYATFWLDPVAEVLSADTVAEMAAPQASDPAEGLSASYGLGIRLHSVGDQLLAGHTGSMPGFLAGLFVDRSAGLGAVTLANATFGRCAAVPLDLVRIVAEREPALPPEWVPESPLEAGAELLGGWFWGNTPFQAWVSGGHLTLGGSNGARLSRFVPAGTDRFTGLDGGFAGEPLRVARTADGAIDHLNVATYILQRTPYGT